MLSKLITLLRILSYLRFFGRKIRSRPGTDWKRWTSMKHCQNIILRKCKWGYAGSGMSPAPTTDLVSEGRGRGCPDHSGRWRQSLPNNFAIHPPATLLQHLSPDHSSNKWKLLSVILLLGKRVPARSEAGSQVEPPS